jgi:succinate dehydrogenase/fumarate reductase flavoprotein subunit
VTDDTDLIVVGFGAAGAAAAITAADRGLRVILVEKQPQRSHTPSSRLAHIVMTVDDVDRATAYFDRCAGGMIPTSVSRAWAERAHGLPEWLDRVAGLRLEYVRGSQHPEFEGADALRVSLATPKGSGVKVEARPNPFGVHIAGGGPMPQHSDFFDALASAVARRDGVRVLWDTRAMRLTKSDGCVDGLVVSSGASMRELRARHGVVLACGGYEFDEEMKLNYLKAYPIHFYGTPANTGDGVRMAQAAGADLWHMNQMIGRAIGHFPLDGGWVNGIVQLNPPGYVLTDKHGKRFANEFKQAKIIEHTFYYELVVYDAKTSDYPRIPCYWFFDSRRMSAGPLAMGAVGAGTYAWSGDNRAELGRGWIAVGRTVAEAGRAAGILDANEAERSVDAYNATCRAGSDPFGRPSDTLVPLDAPPFYCVALYPGGSNTCGGPRRDERARVLDPFGEPLRGLYAAGELGEPFGQLYPSSGSNLSEALCFGQIAAETASAAAIAP